MFCGEEIVFFADQILLVFNDFITELNDLSALCADKMFMMLLSKRILEMNLTCAYIDLGYESVFDKQIKRPVNSRS